MTDFVHPEVHKPYQSKNRYDILPTEVVERIRELEYPSKDFALQFKKNFKCNVLEQRNVNTKYKSEDVLVFELVGIDAAVANALRRILLSEVPTMAIKTVYFHDNSSIVQDEVLAHRLGLVPLKVDPNHFYDLQNEDEKTDYNTLVYKLDVTCRRKPNMDMNKTSAEGEETLDVDYNALEHGIVYASDLEWQPCGTQEERLNKVAPRPVNEDIVLAKLRPGQKIHLEVHAVRGGRENARKVFPSLHGPLSHDAGGGPYQASVRRKGRVVNAPDAWGIRARKCPRVGKEVGKQEKSGGQEPNKLYNVEEFHAGRGAGVVGSGVANTRPFHFFH